MNTHDIAARLMEAKPVLCDDSGAEVEISMAEARMATAADFCFLRLADNRKLMFEPSKRVMEMLLAEDPERLLNQYDRDHYKKLLFFGNSDGIWYGDFSTHGFLLREVLRDGNYELKHIGKPPRTKDATYTNNTGDIMSGTLLFPSGAGSLKGPLVSLWTRDSDVLLPFVVEMCRAEGLSGTLTVEHNKTNSYQNYQSEVTTCSI